MFVKFACAPKSHSKINRAVQQYRLKFVFGKTVGLNEI